jgi:hypothetical protein
LCQRKTTNKKSRYSLTPRLLFRRNVHWAFLLLCSYAKARNKNYLYEKSKDRYATSTRNTKICDCARQRPS